MRALVGKMLSRYGWMVLAFGIAVGGALVGFIAYESIYMTMASPIGRGLLYLMVIIDIVLLIRGQYLLSICLLLAQLCAVFSVLSFSSASLNIDRYGRLDSSEIFTTGQDGKVLLSKVSRSICIALFVVTLLSSLSVPFVAFLMGI